MVFVLMQAKIAFEVATMLGAPSSLRLISLEGGHRVQFISLEGGQLVCDFAVISLEGGHWDWFPRWKGDTGTGFHAGRGTALNLCLSSYDDVNTSP